MPSDGCALGRSWSTSRGLVDLGAVTAALSDGRLGGRTRCLRCRASRRRIAGVPNLISTPHMAYYSEEALAESQRKAATQVIKVLIGEQPDPTKSTETVFRSSLQSMYVIPSASQWPPTRNNPTTRWRRPARTTVSSPAPAASSPTWHRPALQLAFARSSEAHALILGIDTTEAAGRGVAMVATAADLDLPDIPGRSVAVDAAGFSRPHLAGERVRYVGSRSRSPPRAAGVDMPPIGLGRRPAASGRRCDSRRQRPDHPPPRGGEQRGGAVGAWITRWSRPGEIAVELTVHNQRLAPVAVEPLAILVEPGGDRTLTVWCGHQRPHELRTRLARLLGIEPATIRVIVPDVGGAFGMKGMMFPEYTVAAAMAIRLQRPVIWAGAPRALLRGTHGRGSAHTVRLCGGGDGRILRADLAELADVGAYPHSGSSIPAFSRYVATGLYDFSEVHISTTTVVTNRAPTGSYRGAGDRRRHTPSSERSTPTPGRQASTRSRCGWRTSSGISPSPLPPAPSTTRATTPPHCARRWKWSVSRSASNRKRVAPGEGGQSGVGSAPSSSGPAAVDTGEYGRRWTPPGR